MDFQLILIIGALVLGVAIRILASRQTPSQAVAKKPRNLVRVPTVLNQNDVFAVILDYAPGADLAVAEVNPAEGKLILRQDAQILHGGFWLPIYVSAHASGITVVEVGMAPLTPMGGVPDYLLKKIAKQLELLLQPGPRERGA